MPNPVIHFEIMGKNSAKIQQWYREVFGWKIDPMPLPGMPEGATYGTVSAQEDKGIGGGVSEDPSGQARTMIYIEVDDPQAYLNKIEKAGGKTVMPVTEIPNIVTFAMFSDLDGNILGLVKPMPTQ
jgi:hypothetical protein